MLIWKNEAICVIFQIQTSVMYYHTWNIMEWQLFKRRFAFDYLLVLWLCSEFKSSL